ncbi:hypothetical protein BDN70DRAFT_97990 [Pholiota conissans]|uniref:GAR domain-containing protein n=1 Tax=Pholiota conissans TaxID=109636 RepID=A0A9P6CYK5_9AGAR|nr:hypothetical protein BDN70DRAFT_97990 [Pholiota conissans]
MVIKGVTGIIEIQELRHKSQSSGDNVDGSTTTIIDQSLMTLDERLESLEKGIKAVNETLEPLLRTSATPTVSETGTGSENAALLRKHATLISEWESVQDESEVLREELKEDKWLTVFRTVTDQADGMMSSLEKAVNRCQEFIWQVHRRGMDDFQSNAALPPGRGLNLDVFTSLLDSYEAKKKHYMPATSKVLSIIDKGVRDRVTKNGETLRRHAESAQRWKNLRERISRTDSEMEATRRIFLGGESDHESTTSGTNSTKNGYLATPPSGSRMSRVSSSGSAASGSMSPFRKFARKITGGSKPTTPTSSAPSVSPLAVTKKNISSEPPSLSATLRRQRTSLFGSVRNNDATASLLPERPIHKHSMSYTPDSSPRKVDNSILTSSRPAFSLKQRWNSSTKVDNTLQEDRNATIKSLPRRPPSSTGYYSGQHDDIPPVPPIATPQRRSLSRVSMASSRPWSPITSSNSTTHSSSLFQPPVISNALRTPSRSQNASRSITPGIGPTLRTRPKTPSNIPAPAKNSIAGARPGGGWDDDDGVFNNGSQSPTFSTSAHSNASPPNTHPPRPPSRSMIPIPSVHLHTPSRPSSSMSHFSRSESPTMRTFRNQALRAQTPEHALRARAQQVPVFQGTIGRPKVAVNTKVPPSSFRDGTSSRVPSRPGSRAGGTFTPSMDQLPLHEYIPGNNFDPLDVEVAAVVNSIAHGLFIERVDPPLRKTQIPKEGEEIKAQYAFSNALSRKVVTCRLTTMMRSGKSGGDTTTKKVMCRVGGGWQDLSHYILNRQAGLG